MQTTLLFENPNAAADAAYILKGDWDRLNSVTVQKMDIAARIAAREFLAKQGQSNYCYAGSVCRLPATTEMLLILYAKNFRDFQSVDLSLKDLSKAKLAGINFGNANLSHANLKNADLRNANLSHANLYDAYLAGADFSGADLTRDCLQEANLEGANFSGAKLKSANLCDSILAKANLTNANLYNACLAGATLEGMDWTRLKGARFCDYRDMKMSTSQTRFRQKIEACIFFVVMFTLYVGFSITVIKLFAWFNSEYRPKPETFQSKSEMLSVKQQIP